MSLELTMEFIVVAGMTMLLILTISLPLHALIRKLPIESILTDVKFWVSALSVSILVSLWVTFGEPWIR